MIPQWFLQHMPPAITQDPTLCEVFWKAHQYDHESVGIDTLNSITGLVWSTVIDGAGISVTKLRRFRHVLTEVLPGNKDRLPNRLGALVLDVVYSAACVYDQFLAPFMPHNSDYVHMYLRKLTARMLRAADIHVNVEAMMHTFDSGQRFHDSIRELRSKTSPLAADKALVFNDISGKSASKPVHVKPLEDTSFAEAIEAIARRSNAMVGEQPLHQVTSQVEAVLQHVLGPRKNGTQVVAGGGFCVSMAVWLLTGEVTPTQDVDLCIVGAKTTQHFVQCVNEVSAQLVHAVKILHEQHRHRMGDDETYASFLIAETLPAINIGADFDDTLNSSMFQISLRNFPDIASICLSYDMDCCSVVYDGRTLHMTEAALYTLSHLCGTIDPWQLTKAGRIIKYSSDKSIQMVVPFDPTDVCLQQIRKLVDKQNVLGGSVARALLHDTFNIAQAVVLDARGVGIRSDDTSDAVHLARSLGYTWSFNHETRERELIQTPGSAKRAKATCVKEPVVLFLDRLEPELGDIKDKLDEAGATVQPRSDFPAFDRSMYNDGEARSRTHFYMLSRKAAELSNKHEFEAYQALKAEHRQMQKRVVELEKQLQQLKASSRRSSAAGADVAQRRRTDEQDHDIIMHQ